VGGDGAAIHEDLGFLHQDLAALHVTREFYQGMHHPEFSHGQRDRIAIPLNGQATDIQGQLVALQQVLG